MEEEKCLEGRSDVYEYDRPAAAVELDNAELHLKPTPMCTSSWGPQYQAPACQSRGGSPTAMSPRAR